MGLFDSFKTAGTFRQARAMIMKRYKNMLNRYKRFLMFTMVNIINFQRVG